jgi:hypothetical protein
LGGTLSLTSSNVTTALGFTPYNATNPNSYITASSSITGSSRYVSSPDGTRQAGDKLPTTSGNSVRFDFANASTTGTGGNYAGVMTYAPWDGTTSSTGDASYQLAFGSTATNGGGIPQLNIRKGIDSTWNSWYTLWHSGNVTPLTAEADTLATVTGRGASTTTNCTFPDVKVNSLTANNGGTAVVNGTFTLAAGAKFEATYADLAEKYVADAEYEPGTVLELGGEFEVTAATSNSRKVAGVVSTNPSYVLNSECQGEHVVVMALQGRVPCKVRGTIRKGDLLVSCGDGYACPDNDPKLGTVIGRAIENFEGHNGVIEILIGRM